MRINQPNNHVQHPAHLRWLNRQITWPKCAKIWPFQCPTIKDHVFKSPTCGMSLVVTNALYVKSTLPLWKDQVNYMYIEIRVRIVSLKTSVNCSSIIFGSYAYCEWRQAMMYFINSKHFHVRQPLRYLVLFTYIFLYRLVDSVALFTNILNIYQTVYKIEETCMK